MNKVLMRKGNCLVIGIVVVGFFLFLMTLIGKNSKSLQSEIMQSENLQQSNAKFECQEKVKRLLKTPSTAKFPSILEHNFTNLGNATIRVDSYVDAQNLFGATVRNNWTCTIDLTDYDTKSLVYFKEVKFY